jgi:uracil-DNA glycosylase
MEHPTKTDAMELLRERAMETSATYGNPATVWGAGSLDATIALVGEAPGEQERRLRRPFVGPAGQLLDCELAQAGIVRSEIWITNVVKQRPVAMSASGRPVNRPPEQVEIAYWFPYLLDELAILRPLVIVCLGAVAAKAIIKQEFAISKERGVWFEGPWGSRAIATFHPSYLLRSPDGIHLFRQDLAEAKRMSECG